MSVDRYQTFDLAHFASRLIKAALRNLARTVDDTTLKQAVLTAREHGHLSDEETHFYIAAWGLRDA